MSDRDTNAVLQQYVADTGVRSVQKVETDFEQLAQLLPAGDLTSGLSEAFRSEQTPAFDQLVVQSLERSDGDRRAGVLNRLLDAASPAAVRSLHENGVLPADAQPPAVTGEQAGRLAPESLQQIARLAQHDNPEVIDLISNYYAENPALAKTLGVATLNVALEQIARQR